MYETFIGSHYITIQALGGCTKNGITICSKPRRSLFSYGSTAFWWSTWDIFLGNCLIIPHVLFNHVHNFTYMENVTNSLLLTDFWTITDQQVKNLEMSTCKLANCKAWFVFMLVVLQYQISICSTYWYISVIPITLKPISIPGS